jgi:anhydro-N-acetylmuramic acid kinase
MADPAEPGTLFIGLMSGTSMDGIDAALVSFGDAKVDVIATRSHEYPERLRTLLLESVRTPAGCTVDRIGQMDNWIGGCFRDAALALIEHAGVSAEDVRAIGSHGQTIRHQPRAARPFTLQIGDPNIIAAGTGITTVADFRRRDVALGGEGAPLAPAFHHWLFSNEESVRAVLNIGGIANITMLGESAADISGFDTGPGNTLLDAWAREQLSMPFDEKGNWARSGTVSEPLLAVMLDDPYFAQPPPKSTGFEYFNRAWLQGRLMAEGVPAVANADVQATLAELTARTIATALLGHAPDVEVVLVCGGGVHNADLLNRLEGYLAGVAVHSTEQYGLHPDWVEAAAFAWLAKRCLDTKPGNIPAVTGASAPAILGGIYQ